MALKDLFGKTSEKIITKQDLDTLYKQAESTGYMEEAVEDKERFLPSVDFSSASNFARYGSAERYYVDAFKNIYQNYVYDGSKKEKQQWRNNASQLDLYIFDNVYPKTTGYLNLDSNGILGTDGTYRSGSTPQYVKIKGGPNQSQTGKFETANIYDLGANLESNLGITNLGNTVEFIFKDNLATSSSYYSKSYALFDLWNSETTASSNYTRLAIAKTNGANKFSVTYRSGSAGITSQILDYTFDSSTWHQYAFTFANTNTTDLDVCLFIDGNLVLQQVFVAGGGINLANNHGNIANVGVLRSDIVTADTSAAGLGASYGSFDELRFWKTARTSQQIYRNWSSQVGGGSNTDESNRDLGLYLRFNEGIVNDTEINDLDKVCLDYSGRVSNGAIINYDINCRNTGSAIDDIAGKVLEQKDPIIFSSNPAVISVIEEYTSLGFQHDSTNVSSIYASLPAWITEEAQKNGYEDLSNLIQIISSYFDTLHVQIESLPTAKNVEYDVTAKPKPFAKHLLSSNGFENLDIFNDTTFLEDVLSRNEKIEFKEKIYNVKNSIYQNIYNNLSYIYKSKGTEKSLRNLIRCFGIDDELVKINLYSNNSTYDLKTKYTHTSIPKKFVDFNNPDRYNGYIYQKSKAGDSNTKGYIPGGIDSASYIPLTVQAEVIFPKNPIIESTNNAVSDFITSSLFGVHEANSNESILSWGTDKFNFQVYSVKREVGSVDSYFKLTGSFSGSGVELTSSYFKDVYDNQKWNLAVRVKPQKYEQTNLASGSNITDYSVEFVGINSLGDSINNQFSLSASVPYTNMLEALKSNKRIYAGAHYTDFNNVSLEHRTDVKIGSVRFWLDYLNDEELIAHSFEANNIGRQQPNWPPAFFASLQNSSSIPLTRIDTLALHWNFFNVTSSDGSGQFIVEDASSGSVESANIYGLQWLNNIIRYQMPGFADEFLADDTQVVNKEYVFSAKKQNPETLNGNDLVQVVDSDDVTRTKDSRAVSYYISIEKSMAQVVNDEIMNWFATIKSYNNLIGEPAQRYKQEYSELAHLRELFFSRVNNSLSFEKFFEFYKWIDSSLSMMINQLIPASANSSDKVRNMVESHMLERSKYENKLPSIEIKGQPKSYPIVSHLEYNYAEQAAYNNNLNSPVKVSRYYTFNPQWLKQRAIRSEEPVNTTLEPQNDVDREILRQVINERNIDSLPKLYEMDSGTVYDGHKDITRLFSKTYKLSTNRELIIEDSIPVFATATTASVLDSQIIPPYKKYSKGGYSQHAYEKVMMSGRTTNNKSFVELEGNVSGTTSINTVLGIADRTLPVRKVNKNIIVERFSAPGGPEVNSRGYLDAEAEEYSAYNSLNHRNSRVRKNLNLWMGETSSIDSENPSFHKINKNPSYSPVDATSSQVSADYDNGFVVHQIPQSDAQYTWITASLQVKPSSSAFINEWDNLTTEYQFLSASDFFGTSFPILNYRYLGFTVTVPFGNILPTNEILNDKTYDTSSNTIHKVIPNFGGPFGPAIEAAYSPLYTRFFITSLNGPYQWPTWKQIRNNENPLAILSRKNNNILVQDKPKQKTREVEGQTALETYVPAREATFTAYREPPVSYNKPMEQTVEMSGSSEPLELVSTYDNNKGRFVNDGLTNRTGINTRTELQVYDVLKTLEDDAVYEPKPHVSKITYSAQIFPTKVNTGMKETRQKPNYAEVAGTDSNGYDRNSGEIRSFWRDDINNRRRTNAFDAVSKTGSLNVMNIAQLSASTTQSSFSGVIRNEWVGGLHGAILINKRFNNVYDSKFSSDNDTHLFSTASIILDGAGEIDTTLINNISLATCGDLAGMDEVDARQFLTLPSGTYFYQPVTAASGRTYTQENFRYSTAYNFVRPNISYTNKIHYPSTSILDFFGLAVRLQYFVNLGMPFKVPALAGKNPWYDSYDDFFEQLRPLSIDHTILPEYNFSEKSDYYLKEKDGDLKGLPPQNYISLIGSDVQTNSIDNAYNITNKINNFVFKDYQGTKKIKLAINGVKKLLPYKGFYPSERTAQLAGLFQKSFWNISMNDVVNGYPTYNTIGFSDLPVLGTPLIQQMQTLMQPYFAPGILFNTIKAGIAMDWPAIYTASCDQDFFDTTYKRGPSYAPMVLGDETGIPFFYSTSSFDTSSYAEKIFTLKEENLFRVPFESLLDLRGYTPNNTLYYLDPTRVSVESFSGTLPNNGHPSSSLRYNPQFSFENKNSNTNQTRKFADSRYQLAINNFLAETPKFFLQNQSLTNFTSTKPIKEISFTPGKSYEMFVKIEKQKDFKMILDTDIPIYIYSGMYLYGDRSQKISAASTFGPPTQFFNHSTASEAAEGQKAYDAPAYAPYAPPYYYGPQHMKLSFTAQSETYNSYQEIINSITATCDSANSEMADYFSASVNNLGGTALVNTIHTTTAYKNRMPLSSSLRYDIIVPNNQTRYSQKGELLDITNTNDVSANHWRIQTKFETPMLNFNTDANKNFLIRNITTSSAVTGGLMITGSTTEFGFTGLWSGYAQTGSNSGISLSIMPGDKTSTTEDLASLCGFNVESKYVGQIAGKKEISEAIVMIPFTKKKNHKIGRSDKVDTKSALTIKEVLGENGKTTASSTNGPYYFAVNPLIINENLKNNQIDIDFKDKKISYSNIKKSLSNIRSGNSILKTMKTMTEYVIPPHLDWIYNREIEPFAMYIFEFKQDLLGDELADIWQGVMPRSAMRVSKDSVELEHELNRDEFFHGKDLPDDIQWKVFKVKKRAAYSYDSLVTGRDERFEFKEGQSEDLVYSYNWPYDYFSLVELVNIEASLEVQTSGSNK